MENQFDPGLQSFLDSLKPVEKPEGKSFTRSNDGPKDFVKTYLAVPQNQGSIFFLPFLNESNQYAVVLDDVLEFKLMDDSNNVTGSWNRLLPIEQYANIDPSVDSPEKELYYEIKSLFYAYKDAFDWRKKHARRKTYTLLYGYILKHNNVNAELINENICSLLIFDQKDAKESLLTAIKSKTSLLKSTAWISSYFKRDGESRKTLIELNHNYKEGGGGVICSFKFQPINEEYLGITEGKMEVTVPQELIEKNFTHQLKDFYYSEVQDGKAVFSMEKFKEVKTKLMVLTSKNAPAGSSETGVSNPV